MEVEPFPGRKQKSSSIFETSDVTVDKMEDEESVISQVCTSNTSIYLFIHLSIYLSIYPSIYQSIYLSIYQSKKTI